MEVHLEDPSTTLPFPLCDSDQIVRIQHIDPLLFQHVPDMLLAAPWPAGRVPVSDLQPPPLSFSNLSPNNIYLFRTQRSMPQFTYARLKVRTRIVRVCGIVASIVPWGILTPKISEGSIIEDIPVSRVLADEVEGGFPCGDDGDKTLDNFPPVETRQPTARSQGI